MTGPIQIPLWAIFFGPPAFFTILALDMLTGGGGPSSTRTGPVIRALEDYHSRQIDKQFGWDVAPPGSPEHKRQIQEMHEAAYQRSQSGSTVATRQPKRKPVRKRNARKRS